MCVQVCVFVHVCVIAYNWLRRHRACETDSWDILTPTPPLTLSFFDGWNFACTAFSKDDIEATLKRIHLLQPHKVLPTPLLSSAYLLLYFYFVFLLCMSLSHARPRAFSGYGA